MAGGHIPALRRKDMYIDLLTTVGKEQYSDKRGRHINGLEGFWGYHLKRKLVARGGIRKEKDYPYF